MTRWLEEDPRLHSMPYSRNEQQSFPPETAGRWSVGEKSDSTQNARKRRMEGAELCKCRDLAHGRGSILPSAFTNPSNSRQHSARFDIEVDLGRGAVLRDFFAFEQHVERFDVRPLDAADGFGGFGYGALGGLGKTLVGGSDDFDHFLRHEGRSLR